MTDEDLRDEGDASGASDGAARARRIQGEAELMASELERRYGLDAGELALHMLRAQMGRVLRLDGVEGYYEFVGVALDILAEQKDGIEKIAADDTRRRAN